MSNPSMTILVVGADKTGAQTLRQLFKNPKLKILTLDPRESPYSVGQGMIENVYFKEARPDLILLSSTARDMGLGESPGIGMFSDALRDELATIADVPVIETARSSA
jgi:hypothetical protein